MKIAQEALLRQTLARLITLVAVSLPSISLAQATPGSKPYKGNSFDAFLIGTSRPGDLIIFDGEELGCSDDGVSSNNQRYLRGEGALFIESQRRGFEAVQAGVGTNDTRLMDCGLEKIEWGLQPAVLGPDGSFPDQRESQTDPFSTERAPGNALHPKSLFVEAAAHTVELIRQAGNVPPDIKLRAEEIVAEIHLAASNFIDSGNADTFFRQVQNSSQLAIIATGIFEAGHLVGDAEMMARGQGYMEQVLDLQGPAGDFLEQGGYDTGYQLNTTIEITTYAGLLPRKNAFRKRLMNANNLAIDWFLSRVAPDGTVDTTGNSRTGYCGDAIPGPGPKGKEIDKTAIRLYSQAWLAGTIATVGPVADAVQFRGQQFDHIGRCPMP